MNLIQLKWKQTDFEIKIIWSEKKSVFNGHFNYSFFNVFNAKVKLNYLLEIEKNSERIYTGSLHA